MKLKRAILVALGVVTIILGHTNVILAKTGTVNTDTLKLRKSPSTSSTTLELLDEGQKFEVLEEEEDWVKVKVSGMTGYVSKQYVKIEGEDPKTPETSKENTTTEEKTTPTEKTTENQTEEKNTEKENTINTTEPQEKVEKKEIKETSATPVETKSQIKSGTINVDTQVSILPLINTIKISNAKKDEKVTVMDELKNWYYVQTENTNGWVRKNTVNVEETEENNTMQETTQNSKQEDSNPEEKKEQTEVKNNEQPATAEVNTKPDETSNQTNTETKTQNNEKTTEENKEEDKTKETPIQEKTMYVNYSSIYVRKGPATSYGVVDTLLLNAQVVVTAESGDWYKVKVGNKTGYIAKRLLSSEKQQVTSRSAEERTTDKEETQKQENEKIENTTQVASVEEETPSTTSKGQEIVNYAKQYLGCKYVYGGSGPSTFDCSGFTMYVLKHFGVSLSHSATAQSKKGTYVAKSDLQPGDLVFFKDYETMQGIGHVGIYIGGGEFIHASSGSGYCVKISTLETGSYKTRYETARRIL